MQNDNADPSGNGADVRGDEQPRHDQGMVSSSDDGMDALDSPEPKEKGANASLAENVENDMEDYGYNEEQTTSKVPKDPEMKETDEEDGTENPNKTPKGKGKGKGKSSSNMPDAHESKKVVPKKGSKLDTNTKGKKSSKSSIPQAKASSTDGKHSTDDGVQASSRQLGTTRYGTRSQSKPTDTPQPSGSSQAGKTTL